MNTDQPREEAGGSEGPQSQIKPGASGMADGISRQYMKS